MQHKKQDTEIVSAVQLLNNLTVPICYIKVSITHKTAHNIVKRVIKQDMDIDDRLFAEF